MKLTFSRLVPAIATAVLAAGMSACSVSSSHIGSLQLATDSDMTKPVTDSVGVNDQLYAKAGADNIAGKVTVTMELDAVDVKGMPAGPIKATIKSFDIDSDNTVSYHLTPPGSGWPPGTYKVVATMMDNGTQRDQKSVQFTAGTAPAGADSSGGGASSGGSDSGATNGGT